MDLLDKLNDAYDNGRFARRAEVFGIYPRVIADSGIVPVPSEELMLDPDQRAEGIIRALDIEDAFRTSAEEVTNGLPPIPENRLERLAYTHG